LRGDGTSDVARVALATGILDVEPDRVQLDAEILNVGLAEVSEGRDVSDSDGFFPFVGLVSGCYVGCQRSSVTGTQKSPPSPRRAT
jgi:hypothetical protein